MDQAMRALAIAALVVTIIGAGAVLYGVNTLEPVVEQVSVLATPARQAQDVFDTAVRQVQEQTFTGRVFGDVSALDAENCTFVTYTARLANRGFFPAEWIALEVQPAAGDVLQLDDVQANVLPRGSRGDVTATVLHAGDTAEVERSYRISCYVLGKKIVLSGSAK